MISAFFAFLFSWFPFTERGRATEPGKGNRKSYRCAPARERPAPPAWTEAGHSASTGVERLLHQAHPIPPDLSFSPLLLLSLTLSRSLLFPCYSPTPLALHARVFRYPLFLLSFPWFSSLRWSLLFFNLASILSNGMFRFRMYHFGICYYIRLNDHYYYQYNSKPQTERY